MKTEVVWFIVCFFFVWIAIANLTSFMRGRGWFDRAHQNPQTPTVISGSLAGLPVIIAATIFITALSSYKPNLGPIIAQNPTSVSNSPPITVEVPTKVPTVSTSITPTREPQAGAVLYEADWSQGMNGWTGSLDWKTVNGMLVNDGTGQFPKSGLIKSPFQPDNANYAVEAEIQAIDSSNTSGGCAARFGIIVRAQQQQEQLAGYLAGHTSSNCSDSGSTIAIASWESSADLRNISPLVIGRFAKDTDWHKYRVEVQGDTIRLIIDDLFVLGTADIRFLAPGLIALWSDSTAINVRSFKVIEL